MLSCLPCSCVNGLSAMTDKRVYRIVFVNQGKVYEIYAEGVGQGSLFGFVELEGLLFEERSDVVVDPSMEKLKSEFQGVERTYVPMHSVIRIDEVSKQGSARISDTEGGNVTPFPFPVYTPGGSGNQ